MNYFYPSMRLLERTREGAKVTRRHDTLKAPCQRLLENPHVPSKIKGKLRLTPRSLTPLQLKRTIVCIQGQLLDRARRKDLSLILPSGPTDSQRASHDLLFAR